MGKPSNGCNRKKVRFEGFYSLNTGQDSWFWRYRETMK